MQTLCAYRIKAVSTVRVFFRISIYLPKQADLICERQATKGPRSNIVLNGLGVSREFDIYLGFSKGSCLISMLNLSLIIGSLSLDQIIRISRARFQLKVTYHINPKEKAE